MNAPSQFDKVEQVTSREHEFRDALVWMTQTLVHFATAEQAIGGLGRKLGLQNKTGPLDRLAELRAILSAAEGKKFKTLETRIARWAANRPFRNLLAHATINILWDKDGEAVLVTRNLPIDNEGHTPDRVWTCSERTELLRQVSNDARSIADQIRNIIEDSAQLAKLRTTPDKA